MCRQAGRLLNLFGGYLSCDRHLPCALLGKIKPGGASFLFSIEIYGLWFVVDVFQGLGGKASVFRNSSQVDSYEDGIGVMIQTR